MRSVLAALAMAASLAFSTAWAQSAGSGQPIPRFVALNANEVNMRAGPGVRYPVEWVYQRKNMPVEVIAEHDTWRKVRDPEGTEGWIHRAMLSGRRTIVVLGEEITLRRDPEEKSGAVARLTSGVVAVVEQCDSKWCEVSARGFDGWLPRDGVWGLYDGEVVN